MKLGRMKSSSSSFLLGFSSYHSVLVALLLLFVATTLNDSPTSTVFVVAQQEEVVVETDGAEAPGTGSNSNNSNNKGDDSSPDKKDDDTTPTERSVLLTLTGDDAVCTLYQKETEFENGESEESWSCQFTKEQVSKMTLSIQDLYDNGTNNNNEEDHLIIDRMMDIVDGFANNEEMEEGNIVSGTVLLKVSSGSTLVVERTVTGIGTDSGDEITVRIPDGSKYVFEEIVDTDPRHYKSRRRERKRRQLVAALSAADAAGDGSNVVLDGYRERDLAATTGELTTLVVRVIAPKGGPTASTEQLQNDVFEDRVCLKSQYAACSKDQLTIVPASVGNGGIVDIPITINPTTAGLSGNRYTVGTDTMTALSEEFGNNLEDQFDLILVCQPSGSGTWVAYAYLNGYTSFYNDFWCGRVSAQVHEVGHNLGMSHSNEGTETYGDTTGMMGFSYNSDDSPQKCFNAAKAYQLGWYTLQQQSYNPLEYIGETTTFVMNGVNEYSTDEQDTTNKLITLRLEAQQIFPLTGYNDYYVGYNRANGPNIQTNEAPNQIVIVQKLVGGPLESGASNKLAALSVGQEYVIDQYNDSQPDVIIKYESVTSDLQDATISVRTTDLAPTQSPTLACDGQNGRFSLSVTTDRYGSETSWTLSETNNPSSIVASSVLGEYGNSKTYTRDPTDTPEFCLTPGVQYTFTITDSYGDGICCSYGNGGYIAYLDGEQIFIGGTFGLNSIEIFIVDDDEDKNEVDDTRPPTIAPTVVPPTAVPTAVTTAAPTKAPVTVVPSPTNNPNFIECTEDIERFRWKGIERRDCDWIASRGLNKLTKMCKRSDQDPEKPVPTRMKLFVWCPKTCAPVGLGPCVSNANTNTE